MNWMFSLGLFLSYFQIYSSRDNPASAVTEVKPDDKRTEQHSVWAQEKPGTPQTLLALKMKKNYFPI